MGAPRGVQVDKRFIRFSGKPRLDLTAAIRCSSVGNAFLPDVARIFRPFDTMAKPITDISPVQAEDNHFASPFSGDTHLERARCQAVSILSPESQVVV
jgi:hypothetical protein